MEYRQDLIDYRRNKAKETLQDAKILFDAKRTHSTVNRIYYALFYEVTSLLLTKNLSSSKHSGVLSLFNEHFIKIKKVDVELGRFYSTMFEFRQKSDYGDFMEFEEKKIKEWLEKAEKFIQKIEKLIDIEIEKHLT